MLADVHLCAVVVPCARMNPLCMLHQPCGIFHTWDGVSLIVCSVVFGLDIYRMRPVETVVLI